MRAIIPSIKDAFTFVRQNGLWKSLHMKEAPWMIQFGKYGACGALATIIHNVLFFWLSAKVILALDSAGLENSVRAWRIVINNLLAFIPGNIFAYLANLAFVFTGGRHHRLLEFLFFTLVNLVAMLPALVLAWSAANSGAETPYAQVIFIICAALMNFLCRKFFVFKG